ncbi:hypothetical protein D0Z07_0732 [Hyphodiscus hymeniophilus]|uniref:Beta-lactamase-related domain-containing protein n=1 Tax=Hyphodiscus hymeniophilus TaxID=353542 RepID=A0A9P7B104_9HELO|nr:hypothetical protein D0Z07_0732 [Hyphodiscus hymeniophilus]
MDLYAELEHLITSQGPANASPAEVLAKLGSPSVSIAILEHGSIISKSISTIGGDSETLFQACSISKPITGMATMRLVQAGKLQLDSKIVDLLPKHIVGVLETPTTHDLLKQITVRHLMSHTSGLSVSGVPGYSQSKGVPDMETILSGKAPANTLQVRVIGLPGYKFSYSGGGMMVLQVILESVTGKDFPSLVRELVFEPLKMSRSFYILPDEEKNVAIAHFTGYTPCDVDWHFLPERAAAGLWTTPTDLLKAVSGMQQSLKVGGEHFLEPAIAKEMLEEVQNGMALTWMAHKDPGTFWHIGSNLPGWHCFVMGYADLKGEQESEATGERKPLDECGISIMTNSAAGFKVWAKVFHAITYLKKWAPLQYKDGRGVFGTPFCVYGAKVNESWAEWKGSWFDDDKELILDDGGEGEPILRFGRSMEAKLVPAAIPCVEYAGKSVDLVVEGLEMMLRLGWKDDKKKSVELWFDGMPPRIVELISKD